MSQFANAFDTVIIDDNEVHAIKHSTAILDEPNMRRIHEVTVSGHSVVIMSDPGLTKTQTVYHYGRLLNNEYVCRTKDAKAKGETFPFTGAEVYLLDTSVMEVTDFNGLPSRGTMLDPDGNPFDVAVYLAMPWVQKLIENVKRGIVTIVLLDELSNQNPEIQAPLLSFVLDLIATAVSFDRNMVRIVGAMNPAETSVNPTPLKPAFNNRIVKIPFQFNYEYWAEGMRAKFGKPQTANESSWRNVIVRFLNDNPSSRYKLPAEVSGKVVNNYTAYSIMDTDYTRKEIMDTQWASPRSWDILASVLSVIEYGDLTEGTLERVLGYANGTVGYESGYDFVRYYRAKAVRSTKEIKAEVLGNARGPIAKYDSGEFEGQYKGAFEGLVPRTGAPNTPYFNRLTSNDLMEFVNDIMAELDEAIKSDKEKALQVLLETQLLFIKMIHDNCKNALGHHTQTLCQVALTIDEGVFTQGTDNYQRFEFIRQQLIATGVEGGNAL